MERILTPELIDLLETDLFENAQVERPTITYTDESDSTLSGAHAADVPFGDRSKIENPLAPRTRDWSATPSLLQSPEPHFTMGHDQTDLGTAPLAEDVIDPALRSEAPDMQSFNTPWHHGDGLFPSVEALYDRHPDRATVNELTSSASTSRSPSRGGNSNRSSPKNVTTPSPDSTREGSASEHGGADDQVPARQLETRTSGRRSLIVKLKIRRSPRLNDASEGDAGPSRRPDPKVRHKAVSNFYQQGQPTSFHPGLDLQHPVHRRRNIGIIPPAAHTFGQQRGRTSSYPVLDLQQTFQQQYSGYGSQYAPPLGIWAPPLNGFAQRHTRIPVDPSQWPPGTDLLQRPDGTYIVVPPDAQPRATVGEDGRWREHAGAWTDQTEDIDSDTSVAAANWDNDGNMNAPFRYPEPSLGGYQMDSGPLGGEDQRGRTTRSGKRARDEYEDEQSDAQDEGKAGISGLHVESNSEQEDGDSHDDKGRSRKRRRALKSLRGSRAPTQSNTQPSTTSAAIPSLTNSSAQITTGGPTANAGPSIQPIAQNTLPGLVFPTTGVPTVAPIAAPPGPPLSAPALAALAPLAPTLPALAPLAPGPLGGSGWTGVAMPAAAAPPPPPPPAINLPGPPANPVVGITRRRNLPLWNEYPTLTADQIITNFPSNVRGGTLEYVRNCLERQGGSRNGSHLVTVYGQIHPNSIWHGPAFRRAIQFAKEQRDAYQAANPNQPPACQECQYKVLDCSLHHNGSQPCDQCIDANILCQ